MNNVDISFLSACKKAAELWPNKFEWRDEVQTDSSGTTEPNGFAWQKPYGWAVEALIWLSQDSIDEMAALLGWEYVVGFFYSHNSGNTPVVYDGFVAAILKDRKGMPETLSAFYQTKLLAAKAAFIEIVKREAGGRRSRD